MRINAILCLCMYILEGVCILGSSVGGAICVCRPDVASMRSKSFNPAAFVEDESLTITTKYFGASGPSCSHPEDRLVPRRHGADHVEGFPCRSYTVACAHSHAYHARCTTVILFFPQLCGEVTQRPGDVSGFSSCLRGLILPS